MKNDKVLRIFCYDKEIAKKNGNYPNLFFFILLNLLFIIPLIVIGFIAKVQGESFVNNNRELFQYICFFSIGCLFLAFIYFFRISRCMMRQMMVYAVDSNNNVYELTKKNNSDKVYLVGAVGGKLIDKINNDKTFFSSLFMVISFFINFVTAKNISNEMNHPDFVEYVMNNPKQLVNGNVYYLYDVKKIKEKKKYYKITGSYKNLITDDVVVNTSYRIFKSFNCCEELIEKLKKSGAK